MRSFYIGVHKFLSYEHAIKTYEKLNLTEEIIDEIITMREEGFTEVPNPKYKNYICEAFGEAFGSRQMMMNAYNFKYQSINMLGVSEYGLEHSIVREAKHRLKVKHRLQAKQMIFRGKQTSLYDACMLLELDIDLVYMLVKRGMKASRAFVDAQIDKRTLKNIMGEEEKEVTKETTKERYTLKQYLNKCNETETITHHMRKEKLRLKAEMRAKAKEQKEIESAMTKEKRAERLKERAVDLARSDAEKKLIEETMLNRSQALLALNIPQYKFDFAIKEKILHYDYQNGTRKFICKEQILGKEETLRNIIDHAFRNKEAKEKYEKSREMDNGVACSNYAN